MVSLCFHFDWSEQSIVGVLWFGLLICFDLCMTQQHSEPKLSGRVLSLGAVGGILLPAPTHPYVVPGQGQEVHVACV
jgi:hypothetical protein